MTMAEIHVVVAAATKVSIGASGGNRVAAILRRGDIVPEGVSEAQIERLTNRRQIEVLVTDEAETRGNEASDEGAYAGLSVKDLKADLAKRNAGRDDEAKITPTDPGNRPEIIAVLLADDNK